MPKYDEEVKQKAVAAAVEGTHLKVIQYEIGPNPAATMRYLKKAGIDYNKVLAELKAKGIIPKTPERIAKEKAKSKEEVKKATPPRNNV